MVRIEYCSAVICRVVLEYNIFHVDVVIRLGFVIVHSSKSTAVSQTGTGPGSGVAAENGVPDLIRRRIFGCDRTAVSHTAVHCNGRTVFKQTVFDQER